MKRVFYFPFVIFLILFVNNNLYPQIDSCWKLINPNDPANNMFNPDSVMDDSCENSPNYQNRLPA